MTDEDLVPVSVRLGEVVPPEDPEDWTRPLTWVAALGMLAALYALRAEGRLNLPIAGVERAMTALTCGIATRALAGLFVLAGATPAALGLLADISEAFPDDRGAVMGLYSVFLAVGQIIGSVIGGAAADQWAFDGILFATLILMGVAIVTEDPATAVAPLSVYFDVGQAADSMMLAFARENGAALLTTDSGFEGIAGVSVFSKKTKS